MDEILDENSLDMVDNDNATKCLQGTTNLDKGARPLESWKRKSLIFLNVAAAGRRYLAMQSSFVAGKSVFRVSGNLVDAERTRHSDESVTACMCSQVWERLLDSFAK